MTVAPIEHSLGLKSIEIVANFYLGCQYIYGTTLFMDVHREEYILKY